MVGIEDGGRVNPPPPADTAAARIFCSSRNCRILSPLRWFPARLEERRFIVALAPPTSQAVGAAAGAATDGRLATAAAAAAATTAFRLAVSLAAAAARFRLTARIRS